MRSYAASAVIHAAPARIWAILTDGASYGDWDSGVVRLEGTIAPDERIKVVSAASPRRAFPVRVTGFVPGEEMPGGDSRTLASVAPRHRGHAKI